VRRDEEESSQSPDERAKEEASQNWNVITELITSKQKERFHMVVDQFHKKNNLGADIHEKLLQKNRKSKSKLPPSKKFKKGSV